MAQHSLDNQYANQAGSNFATLAGASIVAAPGAGQRFRILGIVISGNATGAAATASVGIQFTVGGVNSAWIKSGLNGATLVNVNLALPCNLLCDENTGVFAKMAGADVANGGYVVSILYRQESGAGTT